MPLEVSVVRQAEQRSTLVSHEVRLSCSYSDINGCAFSKPYADL